MNRFVILLLVVLAIAVGYAMGTEQGRQQRDQLIQAINKKRGLGGDVEDDLVDLTEAAEDAVASATAS